MTTALVAYVIAALLGLVWFLLVALPMRLRAEPELSAPQLALLRRRTKRAALDAAVAQLSAADLVTVDARGRLQRADAAKPADVPEAADLPELAQAVYGSLDVPRSLRWIAIRPPVRAALRSAVDELAQLGAVPSRTRWLRSRLALAGVVVAALLGLSRAGALPPPLVLLALVLVVAAVAAGFLPRRTIAGARLLRRLRTEG